MTQKPETMTQKRETIADLVEECTERGFETPFWIDVTDQTGNTVTEAP